MRSAHWLWAALFSAVLAAGSTVVGYLGATPAALPDPAPGGTTGTAVSQIAHVSQRLQALIPQAAPNVKAETATNPDPNLKVFLEVQALQQAELRQAIRELESSLAALKRTDHAAVKPAATAPDTGTLTVVALVPAFMGALCTVATLVLAIHRNRREHEEGLLKFEQMRLQIEDLKRKLALTAGGTA